MHRVRGASGAVLARGPGFPPDIIPRAPPSPPVSTPPETTLHGVVTTQFSDRLNLVVRTMMVPRVWNKSMRQATPHGVVPARSAVGGADLSSSSQKKNILVY